MTNYIHTQQKFPYLRIFSNVWFKLNLESQRKDDLRKLLVAAFVTAVS